MNDPSVCVTLSTVNIEPGEVFTVYLGDFDSGRTQVELRVLPDGTRQVFLPEEYMDIVRPFEDWKVIQ